MTIEHVNKLQTGDILPQEHEQFHVKLPRYVVLLHLKISFKPLRMVFEDLLTKIVKYFQIRYINFSSYI